MKQRGEYFVILCMFMKCLVINNEGVSVSKQWGNVFLQNGSK